MCIRDSHSVPKSVFRSNRPHAVVEYIPVSYTHLDVYKRQILNGLGKDAAKIISRINGFTYVQTEYDYFTGELKEVQRIAYSDGLRSKVNCYGANDVREGVAIMWKEGVDVSITGNSTNPTRFQHPVAGTYKKECNEKGKKYFSVASGGGTGRTLHPCLLYTSRSFCTPSSRGNDREESL